MLTKLGKYIIKSELGHGAMGVVYLAEDPRLHRPVALKTMSASVAGVPDLLKRFYREAESAGQLRHPNIVTIYDIDEAEGTPFIAMEFLEGEPLEQVIKVRKELSGYVKIDYILQTCRALHYAHKRGIVHRDVKPANIMVLSDGTIKIVDFGIAHISEASMTRSGLVLGTPMYMSPEQIRGKTVDARSDIFSIGVILYELLTFSNPFQADNVPAIIYRVLNETPPPVSTLVEDCPPAMDSIVARAIAKDRGERYQTAEDLAFDLQQQADYLKRHMMNVYVNEGERLIQEGNLTLARESLQKALGIDSGHNEARSLLLQVQELIQVRQNREKIDQGLRRAQDALQRGGFDEALDLFEEVLRLNPGNAQAEEGKKLASFQVERQREIARHLDLAEEFAAAGDLAGTQGESEKLLTLDPENKRALQLLEWARREIAEQQRLAQVLQYVESAQGCLMAKDFTGALDLLEKAQALDPVNLEIESLRRTARESLKREERKKLLNQQLAGVQEALSADDFDRAVELADECLREFPNNPQATKMRAQAARQGQIQKDRRFVEQQLRAATESFQKNQFPEAIAILEKTLEKVPGDVRLVSYLKTVRDAQKAAAQEEIRRAAITQAHELISAEDFSGAVRVLEGALQRAGQSPELTDFLQFARTQQAEQDHQRQLAEQLDRAERSAAAGDLAGARLEAEKLLALDPGHNRAAQLLEWARQGLAEQERKNLLKQQILDIQEAIATENLDRAVQLADACLREFPDNPQALQLRAQATEKGEAQRVRQYVEEQLGAATDSFQKKQFPAALSVLESALERVPGDARLSALLKRVRDAQKVADIQEARRDAGVQAHALMNGGDFAGAIQLLETTFQSSGLSHDLVELLKFARTQQSRQEQQQKLDRQLEHAEELATSGDMDGAKEEIERILALYPENKRAMELRAWANREQAEQERKKRLAQRLGRIKEALRAEKFDRALTLADECLQEFPEDPEAVELRAQAARQAELQQERQYVEEQYQAASESFQRNDFSASKNILESTLKKVPNDARLMAYLKTVREAEEAAESQELRRTAAAQANESIRAGDFARAVQILETALPRAGKSPELTELLERAQAQQAEQTRQQQLAGQLEKAEKLAAAGDLTGVQAASEKLLTLDPTHKRAVQLLEWAKQEIANQEREKLLSQRLAGINEAINLENFDLALHRADACLKDFPDDPQATKLRAQAERQGQLQKERRYVEEQLEAATMSLQKSDFTGTTTILESALQKVPGDAALTESLKKARSAQKLAELQEARRDAGVQAHALVDAGNFAAAIQVLESTFQSVGLSPDLVEFLKFARTQQAEQQRQELRQEQIRQVLARAQSSLQEENFTVAIRMLEQSQAELPAKEIADALAGAQEQRRKFEQKRQQQRQERVREVLARAQASLQEENFAEAIQFLEQSQAETPAKEIAAALADAQEQRRKYEQRREETFQQALQVLQGGDPAKAITLLDAAPKAYFNDPRFSRVYSQCQEELSRITAIRQTAQQVEKSMAAEKWAEAERLLRTAVGTYPDDPTLLAARKKLEQARTAARRNTLARQLQEAKSALDRKQYGEALKSLSSQDWQAGDFPDLARQANALMEEARRREQETSQQQTVIRQVAPGPAPSPGPVAVGPAPPPPTPAPPAPGPVPAKPPVSIHVAQPPVAKVTPAPVKRTPVALWAGIGVAVVVLAAAAWWGLRGPSKQVVGYAQVSAVPWAEVVSVKTKGGQPLNVKGQTPVQLELPPGDYIIQLKNDQGSGQTEVIVKAGEVASVNYTFPQVNVDAWVDKLVSK